MRITCGQSKPRKLFVKNRDKSVDDGAYADYKYAQMTTAANQLLSYREVAALFKAAGLASSTRTVYRAILAHPEICPLQRDAYHLPRVKRKEALLLVKTLCEQKPRKEKSK